MVWFFVIRVGMPVFADKKASAWAWRKQVHLVRIDKHWTGLPP